MKEKFLNVLAAALFLIATTGSANAELLAVDLFTQGDGLLTYDTGTGLYWLDLTVTVNMSYNDVLNELNEGGSLEGFRYATTADIDTLQVSAGLFPGLYFETTVFPFYLDKMSQLINLVGITDSNGTRKYSSGITSDPFAPNTPYDRIFRYLRVDDIVYQAAQGVVDDDLASSTMGNWLVTDTRPILPAPDTDNDGVPDGIDNCVDVTNPEQADFDLDGIGDSCDNDIDGDTFLNDIDCNDYDPSIHPNACDIKGDGIDQDCDGQDRTKGKACN